MKWRNKIRKAAGEWREAGREGGGRAEEVYPGKQQTTYALWEGASTPEFPCELCAKVLNADAEPARYHFKRQAEGGRGVQRGFK